MKWFYDMKISTKLLSGFILVAVIATIIGIVGFVATKNIERDSNLIAEVRLPSIKALGVMNEAQTAVKAAQRSLLIRDLPEKNVNDQFIYIPDALKRADDAMRTYEPLEQTADEAVKWKEFLPAWNKWKEDVAEELKDQVEMRKLPKGSAEYTKHYNDCLAVAMGEHANDFKVAEKLLGEVIAINLKNAVDDKARLNNTVQTSNNIIIAVIILGFIISIGLGVFIAAIISKPIKKLAEASDMLAVGDIDINLKLDRKDEVGILAGSFQKMIDGIKDQVHLIGRIAEGDMAVDVKVRSEKDIMNQKLEELVEINNQVFGDIRNAADQVEAAAGQVAAGSQTMAQGATQQASTVEETNASIEEFATQVKENANNSRKANELAVGAKNTTSQGSSKMNEMMKSMTEINDASANISKIIKVIDEIAFQTNILALNAAVEAARAGAHGKGFAVVAEEVRNLAARSSEAAKETTALIEGTIRKTGAGMSIAKDTADSLSSILGSITEVASTIDTIFVASNEQAAAIAQISQAIEQVSGTTQTNSATAEESASASEELSGQALMLKDSISRFRLKKNGDEMFSKQRLEAKQPHKKIVESTTKKQSGAGMGSFGKY